jgi:hypothetical protein
MSIVGMIHGKTKAREQKPVSESLCPTSCNGMPYFLKHDTQHTLPQYAENRNCKKYRTTSK